MKEMKTVRVAVVGAGWMGRLRIKVEKPMATTLGDCDAMISAGKRAKKSLMVGQTLRFDPRYAPAAERIHNGETGVSFEETKHFIKCVRKRAIPQAGGEAGRAAVQIVIAAQQSIKKGTKIKLYQEERWKRKKKKSRIQ